DRARRRPRRGRRRRAADRMGRVKGAALLVVGLAAGLGACRERAEAVQGESELRTLVRQMIPSVERAAGLKFKTPPVVERRSRAQMASMKEFAHAPLWLRESVIFPYLAGADFVRWFDAHHPGREPFGAAMPLSTEQILHPDRYAAEDAPVDLAFSTADRRGAR